VPDPDALLSAATRALASRGAEVRVFAGADNSVRPREDGESDESGSRDAAGDRLPFVVEVEGVPNLFHELAHVLLLGRVEKDHGTRAAEIPFDLATPKGRRLLFDELACCVASASWHPGSGADADAWFAEQVGIQDCFFGMQGDLPRFFAAAEREVAAHRAELDEVVARAHRRVAAALAEEGAPPEVARPRRLYDFERGWRMMVGR
jgi:hypothetical protein